MKFGLFYELSVPRPWTRESERTVYDNALEQIKLADQLGFDPHYTLHKAERGRPKLSRFDQVASNAEGLAPLHPIAASFTSCDTDLPQIRFVMDADLPVTRGTRKIR